MTAQRTLAFANAEPVVTVGDGLRIVVDRVQRTVTLTPKGHSPIVLKDSTARALSCALAMAANRAGGKT